MPRKLVSISVWLVLALTGCHKLHLFGKKKEDPTPAPVAVAVPVAPPANAPAGASPASPSSTISQPTLLDTNASVIVLCYHRFEDRPKDALAINPTEFAKQMDALQASGFTVISMQDFLAWRRSEKAIPEKSCLITIDDGYRSGYEVAWPILKQHHYPFTMFIYTDYVKGQPKAGGQSLSWEELGEMRDAGVALESHTISHGNFAKRGKRTPPEYEAMLRHEFGDSKKMLEERLGISVKALAYPYGIHNEEIRKVAMECGYEAAFTVYGQRLTHHSPEAQLGRYAVESIHPKIFADALKMIGGGVGPEPDVAQAAAISMITVPMEGETISDPLPKISANLAVLGEIDPGTLEIRVSGIGLLPAVYDPATKTATAKVSQKLKDTEYRVLLSAKVKGRKIETSWSFKFDPASPGAAPEATLPPRPPSGAAPVTAAGTKPPPR